MTRQIFCILIVLAVVSVRVSATPPRIDYKMSFRLNEGQQLIGAEVEVTVDDHAGYNGLEFILPAEFKLQEAAAIDQTEINSNIIDLQYIGKVRSVTITASDPSADVIGFSVSYSGKLDTATMNHKLLNFSNEAFWYPFLNPFSGIIPVTSYHVEFSSNKEFHLTVPNARVAAEHNHYKIDIEPGIQLLQIYGSDRVYALKLCEGFVEVRYDKLTAGLTREDTLLAQSTLDILKFFHARFAGREPVKRFHFIRHPYTGNSYAFTGGFIFREEGYKEKASFHRYLAHEVSHSWWKNGSNADYNRWLNESFAEYSGHLYVRHKFGEQAYNDLIVERMRKSYDADPVYQTEKFYDYSIMYDKGSYRLYQLHQKIGDEKFYMLLQRLIEEKVPATDDVLKILEQITDPETREWFLTKLKM